MNVLESLRETRRLLEKEIEACAGDSHHQVCYGQQLADVEKDIVVLEETPDSDEARAIEIAVNDGTYGE